MSGLNKTVDYLPRLAVKGKMASRLGAKCVAGLIHGNGATKHRQPTSRYAPRDNDGGVRIYHLGCALFQSTSSDFPLGRDEEWLAALRHVFALAHWISPSQYAGSLVLGVPPLSSTACSSKEPTRQPFGIGPNSDSSNPSGNNFAVAASMPSGFRPSILARTGSKSTNQLLKIARAIASSVSFIRRLSSILSSSVPRMWAMAFCSDRGGMVKRKFGMSAFQAVENGSDVDESPDPLPPLGTAGEPTKKRRKQPLCRPLEARRGSAQVRTQCPLEHARLAWIATTGENHVVVLRLGLARPIDEVLRGNSANIGEIEPARLELRNRDVGIAALGGRWCAMIAVNQRHASFAERQS